MGLQSHKYPNFGSHGIKSLLDVGSMASHRVYYKREGGDFPQVQAVVSLVSFVSPNLPMVRLNTKNAQIMY